MKLRTLRIGLMCASFGSAMLFALLFAPSSRSVPAKQAAEVVAAERIQEGADSSFAEAERLRAQQQELSNRCAIEKYEEAAESWRAARQFEKAASALRNAGEVSQSLGETQHALSRYKNSLALSKKGKSLLEESRVLNDLSYLHFIAGNTEEARRNCQLALQLGKAVGNNAVVAQATSNLGETFYGFGSIRRSGRASEGPDCSGLLLRKSWRARKSS